MIQVVCFFAPAFLAVLLFEKKNGRSFSRREFVSIYAILVGIINMVCCFTIAVVFRHPEYILGSGIFSMSFVLRYLLLGFGLAVMIPVSCELFKKYKKVKKVIALDKKQKIYMAIVTAFFFVFTVIIFTPYDIYFANRADFVFGFADFWWIMASFGLLVFVVLTVAVALLPTKLFAAVLSLIFSLTLSAYIQRMFLNLFITSMTGEPLNTGEHPLWAAINLLIWLAIIFGTYILLKVRGDIWKRMLPMVSLGLVFVQAVALTSLVFSVDSKGSEQKIVLTTDGLYEVASDNNILVFVLDHYDFSYVETVLQETPDFYDKLEGFTYFDNTTAVYSRSYPSNTYLLTGLELDEYHEKPYEECVDIAFSESAFLPYLKELGYDLGVYTLDAFVSNSCQDILDNYTVGVDILYWETVREFLRCGFYFESPYIIKPVFWFYDEIRTETVRDNSYNNHDDVLYQHLTDEGLSVSDSRYNYKYIHTLGAHAPYIMNENCEVIGGVVEPVQQWKGCVNMVCEYLDQMKELGVYDDATIIITADHGHVNGTGLDKAVAPILFFKPANAPLEPLKISHAPISHADIFPTIIQAAGGEYASYGSGEPILSIDTGSQRIRSFHYTELDDWKERRVIDYAITGDCKEFDNWGKKSSKKVMYSIYAVAE